VSFENASLHQLIQEQAITDPLTGLLNRRRFGELLANETARAKRLGHPLGLIMLDVDSFKEANDTHGHQTGDAVLEAAASLLANEVREIDVVARFGGDEFVAVLPETDLNGAAVLAERIRTKVADLKVKAPDGSTLTVTASLGVASLPDSAHDGETLLAAADLALYEAKRGGKNRVSRSEGTAAPR
jgi:diguanylate cyclase (GGDEF)-like protein